MYPTKDVQSKEVKSWIQHRENEPIKRFSVDIPERLHRAIKSDCSARGIKIADEIRASLSEKYGNLQK
ncbi:Arc-type ribbon-helix-helix (plasmid) [Zymomonas mobilis subsp. mobilis ZM4 = ATCC 31821]|uniref:Uncharacterized protein n=1 Tax=Zymomonas mobilis subsp. mobilis (strain ATCC 31821 / ZM4 / CP4) TaxID=264203 RepID=Q8GF48_ZYMMO|nr:hypothetical protein [Zymomonas mobilis]AAL36120.1 unknown [Zymomonas mobilis subsp. mobilis ZM4 = ATCC 31821]AVZ26931.1 Arc-type ribbon-helix-helix [Zymomonas mobilis subsp. mobilis]AVZ28770.1 Arc-type ribbon-helix-helix [Zymomonas mobilis subsp. mobilis]AVZ43263.1 Arc-type ribbon-helix-helix [Zymomonas mobilis subsp. mobilis ZM4 = ATCC 31821]UBQ08663.1 hypothetical protein LB319_09105 [Zymomonas mobilis]